MLQSLTIIAREISGANEPVAHQEERRHMKLVYFDTNIWNRLVEPEGPPFSERELVDAYRSGGLAIVGSIVALEELVGAARSDMHKYKRMHRLFWRLVGSRVLRPLNERHIAERDIGGALPEDARYLSKGLVSRARQETVRGHSAIAISTAVLAQKIERFTADRVAKASARRSLTDAGFDVRAGVLAWFEEDASFDEWATDAAAAGASHGQGEWPAGQVATVDTLPSAWMFAGYMLARVHQTLGLGADLKKSDRDDG